MFCSNNKKPSLDRHTEPEEQEEEYEENKKEWKTY